MHIINIYVIHTNIMLVPHSKYVIGLFLYFDYAYSNTYYIRIFQHDFQERYCDHNI